LDLDLFLPIRNKGYKNKQILENSVIIYSSLIKNMEKIMKIEIKLFDQTGEIEIGKAIETDCRELIINGVRVISNGRVNTQLRQLEVETGHNTNPSLENLN
jgi:hypothetical protein